MFETPEVSTMTRPKKTSGPAQGREMAKIDAKIMRDARIVVAYTGERLTDYLSRLLAPLVSRDLEREQTKATKSRGE